jgi:hypothetical protein
VGLNEARMKKDIQKAKAWYSKHAETLRKADCRKVVITPLGDVRYAHD